MRLRPDGHRPHALAGPLLVLAALVLVAAGGRGDEAMDALLARVNGEAVTLADLDEELTAMPAATAAGGRAPEAAAVLRRLIQNRLLEQEGYRMGVEAEPAVRNQVQDLLRLRSVVALLDSISAPAASAGALRLDSLMSQESELRHVAHILLPTEAAARALLDSLAAGTAFADLARRHSTDATAARGGDLGWRAVGAYLPVFEAALAPLASGEVGGPLQTEFGWHLLTVLGTRRETGGQSPAMREAMDKSFERETRMAAVRAYVAGLRQQHGVAVDDSLLASLDFGSEDPAVLAELRASDAVLATLPTGRLTVQGLFRQIIFKHFHGLAGRPEAASLRDEVFREWVDEALLSYEAQRLGLRTRATLQAEAKRLERSLLREEVLKTLLLGLSSEAPPAAELEAFYAADPARFAAPARVKLRSLAFADSASAAGFRERLAVGAQFAWLAGRDPGVMAGPPPFGEDWLEPAAIGLADRELTVGAVLGPLPHGDGWALVQVQALEKVAPPTLAACRAEVLAAYQRDRQQEAVRKGLARLEAAATIELAAGAEAKVAARLAARAAAAAASAPPPGQQPEGGQH
jgi:peptidyl-prolyl cis-trans isomerase C